MNRRMAVGMGVSLVLAGKERRANGALLLLEALEDFVETAFAPATGAEVARRIAGCLCVSGLGAPLPSCRTARGPDAASDGSGRSPGRPIVVGVSISSSGTGLKVWVRRGACVTPRLSGHVSCVGAWLLVSVNTDWIGARIAVGLGAWVSLRGKVDAAARYTA